MCKAQGTHYCLPSLPLSSRNAITFFKLFEVKVISLETVMLSRFSSLVRVVNMASSLWHRHHHHCHHFIIGIIINNYSLSPNEL